MTHSVTFGKEDGPFYFQHIQRSGSFERTNHMHDVYELYYLYHGERMYFIKDHAYLITPGDLVLIKRRELHATADSDKLGHERVVMNFSESFLGSATVEIPYLLDAFAQGTPVLQLEPAFRPTVEAIFQKMMSEIKEPLLGQHFLLRQYLIELLLLTARYVRMHPVQAPEHLSPLHEKISKIVQYINAHYMENIRLEDVAERFHMNPTYVSRMFKRVTGFAFVEYIHLVRIQEAQRLLATTTIKVIDIADQVGFGSLVQFGRVFREICKTTPLRYRRASRM
ncbi:AraC family transcriptional regulator [Paenibacillus hexagrammi]|uniref:AraC family transcriptional regulator n=1 Tax=Paenibacillus hexagrammi TaxID=2908839 RepID=A0ABY3SEH5_9BACL|nr:AraC family transcriptional regulator [Paenibacillus sp. YPD9-1]UJF32389.1 AraC family transcriptional regulator [Paenibacillus sp. YPD9-1]